MKIQEFLNKVSLADAAIVNDDWLCYPSPWMDDETCEYESVYFSNDENQEEINCSWEVDNYNNGNFYLKRGEERTKITLLKVSA